MDQHCTLKWVTKCYGLNCIPPNSRWSPNPQCDCIWDRAFRRWGPNLIGLVTYRKRKEISLSHPPGTSPKERLCEQTARRHPSVSQEENPYWISWYLDLGLLSFHNCEKMNFCWSSHLVYGILLWQPKLTNTARLKARNLAPYFMSLPET